jgi:hypothetical protein
MDRTMPERADLCFLVADYARPLKAQLISGGRIKVHPRSRMREWALLTGAP